MERPPVFLTVMADIVAWLVIHLGVAGLLNRVSLDRLEPGSWLFRKAALSVAAGRLYDNRRIPGRSGA